jgi:hypothetical protein
MAKITIEADPASVSDGYHTIAELYDHRCALFCALLRAAPIQAWRSWKHNDGSGFDGWFIAGLALPDGSVTYHLPARLWETLTGIETLDNAPPWDGHTSADVVKRLEHWASLPF